MASPRTELKEDALKLAVSILQSAKDPENIFKHGKYFGTTLKWDLNKKAVEKFLVHPRFQPLVEERYEVPWPSLDEMSAMPKGSLGFCFQNRMHHLDVDILPKTNKNAEKIMKMRDKEDYMFRRLRTMHDIHHLVLGVDTSVAGEAAATAYSAVSTQMPGVLGALTAFMTHSFIEPDEHSQIWAGLSFGTQVGLAGVFLEGCRWEEGWERPLAEWRSELGLTPLLEKSPFQDEVHRWEALSPG
jgi:ubiquinone biosynthesis protein Coq4